MLWHTRKENNYQSELLKESRCAVRADGQVREWFDNFTGVRQGFVQPPLLFILDWILKRTADGTTHGIEWREGERLADLNLADDIALLEPPREGMIEPTGNIEEVAAKVARIHTWMNVNDCLDGPTNMAST